MRRRRVYRVERLVSGQWLTVQEYTAKRPAYDHARRLHHETGSRTRLAYDAPDLASEEEYARVSGVIAQF